MSRFKIPKSLKKLKVGKAVAKVASKAAGFIPVVGHKIESIADKAIAGADKLKKAQKGIQDAVGTFNDAKQRLASGNTSGSLIDTFTGAAEDVSSTSRNVNTMMVVAGIAILLFFVMRKG